MATAPAPAIFSRSTFCGSYCCARYAVDSVSGAATTLCFNPRRTGDPATRDLVRPIAPPPSLWSGRPAPRLLFGFLREPWKRARRPGRFPVSGAARVLKTRTAKRARQAPRLLQELGRPVVGGERHYLRA